MVFSHIVAPMISPRNHVGVFVNLLHAIFDIFWCLLPTVFSVLSKFCYVISSHVCYCGLVPTGHPQNPPLVGHRIQAMVFRRFARPTIPTRQLPCSPLEARAYEHTGGHTLLGEFVLILQFWYLMQGCEKSRWGNRWWRKMMSIDVHSTFAVAWDQCWILNRLSLFISAPPRWSRPVIYWSCFKVIGVDLFFPRPKKG